MKIKFSLLLAALVVVASAFTLKSYVAPETGVTEMEINPKKWMSVEEAIVLAHADQKKILIDVYTDWCKWCKVMDEKTFSNSEVEEYLSKNYHLVKFNAEQKESLTFNGVEYQFKKNGRRGYHEFAAEILNGQLAYPSLVLFDSKLNKLEVVRGFKNPADLLQILKDNA